MRCRIKYYIFIAALLLMNALPICGMPHYYCTPADAAHYHLLKNLIGSIHHVDFDNLGEIAVFDLGFNAQQRIELAKMQKVKVYDVEMIHQDILTYFTTAPNGRSVRGYFAWKPVIIKQALDMFPYVLYLDAGTTVLKPLDGLFHYIEAKGYFLLSCSKVATCNVPNRLTHNVINAIVANRTLQEQACAFSESTYMIDAGLQGISRQMMESYVLPMYNFARDLNVFKDDGTAKLGYGAGRHDQTLFTLLAYWLNLTIHEEGFINLDSYNQNKPMHIYWDRSGVNDETIIYRSRHDHTFDGGRAQYIRYQ